MRTKKLVKLSTLLGLSLSLISTFSRAEDKSHAQDQLEAGIDAIDDSLKGSTYIEGIPPVSYRGKTCEQTQAEKNKGSKSVTVSCYFEQDGIKRQCTFDWVDISNVAEITVQTYEFKTEGSKQTTIQSNSSVTKKEKVTWKNVANEAQKMVDLYCGAELKMKKITTHTEEPIKALNNGFQCTLRTLRNDGDKYPDRAIVCYDNGIQTQCTVQEGCSDVEYSVTKYKAVESKVGKNALNQTCPLSSKLSRKNRIDDEAFKKDAYDWLNKHCR